MGPVCRVRAAARGAWARRNEGQNAGFKVNVSGRWGRAVGAAVEWSRKLCLPSPLPFPPPAAQIPPMSETSASSEFSTQPPEGVAPSLAAATQAQATGLPLPSVRPHLPDPSFVTLRVITALILREMQSTYGRSAGGYVWAIVQPVGMLLVLSVGFSLLLRAPSLGTSFLLFFATGFLPFNLYSQLAQKVGTSIRYSRSLLRYPRVTWVDAIAARATLNVLTNLTVMCLLLAGVVAVIDSRTVLDMGPIINGVGMAILLGIAVGMANCFLIGMFPIWKQVWTIISRPLFLASGIFYLYEDLPDLAQQILWWNPLIHATGLVRAGLYPTYEATYATPAYGYGLALAGIAMALLFLRRHRGRLMADE